MEFLHGKQREVAARVLAEEGTKRHHLVMALSGSHAYGFPSADSDLDLKAVHIERTTRLLGLGVPTDGFNRLEVIDGVEIDYTSNELRGVLAGILAGNGNYIERILGALLVHTTPELDELAALVPAALSRRVHRHYRGFATSQRKAFEAAETPTVKKLLYVLRTALTGVHLLRSAELRVDLTDNMDEYGFGDARQLIEMKKQHERTTLAEVDRDAWAKRLDGLFAMLDEARDHSVLPIDIDATELERWLIDVRMREPFR